MNKLGIILRRGDGRPSQEQSSPEDEGGSSFHTPQHAPIPNGGSALNFVASQDSIDVFHDACSTLNRQQHHRVPPLPAIHQSPLHQGPPTARRRHASSGAKFEEPSQQKDVADWEPEDDEISERTSMLTKGPLGRVRHSSFGRGSRSCNGSPFHSTTKRTGSTPLGLLEPGSDTYAPIPSCMVNYVPCVEVDLMRGLPAKKGDIVISLYDPLSPSGPLESTKHLEAHLSKNSSTQTPPVNGYSNLWVNNYVPCAELDTLLYPGGGKIDEADRELTPGAHFAGKFYSKENRKKDKEFRSRFKEELALSNLKLDHKAPHLFVTSQWQKQYQMSCWYLGYRLFWGVYFLMWAIWSFARYKHKESFNMKFYYFCYLTNWGIWTLAVDTVIQAVNVILHMRKISIDGDGRYDRMKSRLKISWVASNITYTLHILITIVFWLKVYQIHPRPFSPVSINTHLVPFIYVLLDLCVSATPRRILHVYWPLVYLYLYGIFTLIYYWAGGTNIRGEVALYPEVLDWSNFGRTLIILSILSCIAAPIFHIFVWGQYQFRLLIWRCFKTKKYLENNGESENFQLEEKV